MKPAADFSLPDQDGAVHALGDYRGMWLVLYFYPEDETPGCTAEACAFRDGREVLTSSGAEVVGVSNDSVESHKAFSEHNGLNFTLLSDEDGAVAKAYGVWGTRPSGKVGTLRQTFLIDPMGNIAKRYPEVSPNTHAIQVLNDIKKLQ